MNENTETTMQTPSENATEIQAHAEATAALDEHADDEEIVRQLKGDEPNGYEQHEHYIASGELTGQPDSGDDARATITPLVTGEFVNASLRNVRAPFDARKKRGAEFKGARTRLDKMADAAVREFRGAYLSELSDTQALRISLGITGLAGDNVRGFVYVDSEER